MIIPELNELLKEHLKLKSKIKQLREQLELIDNKIKLHMAENKFTIYYDSDGNRIRIFSDFRESINKNLLRSGKSLEEATTKIKLNQLKIQSKEELEKIRLIREQNESISKPSN